MISNDNIYQTALVSLAGAVVQAMLSEDAETAFIEEARNLLDQLGDTLTLPVASIISLEQLDRRERLDLLTSTLQDLGLDLQQLDWKTNPELALEFQSRIWAHLFQRFLNTHQVLSSHVELLPEPAVEYQRPLQAPDGSWLLLYAESGECQVTSASASCLLGAGGPGILLLPSQSEVLLSRSSNGVPCSLFSSSFFPRESWLPLLPASQPNDVLQPLTIWDPSVAEYISESYGRIIDISHSRRGRHTRALHFNLIEQILLLCDELTPRQEGIQLDRRVVAARDFLLAHYREKTTVEQVAAAANAAPSTLTALFKSQMGDNLMRWRDQLRMQRARELLQESDKPIKLIANEVGYDDPMFFSRRFKQLTGWSPTQIRDSKTS